MLIYSGKVIYSVWGNYATDIFVSQYADCEKITSVHVPLSIMSHKSWNFYWFPNLLEIVAHPDSPQYITYDGALYSKYGELLYIPKGKKTIRLAPFLKSIDYRAFWNHNNLKEVSIDSSNDSFDIYHGCLVSKDNKEVYFVANEEQTLYISATTQYIAQDVLSQHLENIVIEAKNSHFEFIDGMLIHDGYILYVLNRDVIRIPASVTKITAETASQLYGYNGQRTVITINHPVFRTEDGALYNKKTKELIFLSSCVRSFDLLDGYTFGRGSLFLAGNLQEISVPQDLQISKGVFECVKGYDTVSASYRNMDREYKSITVRCPDGTTYSFPGKIVKSIRIIQKETVEVKSGTEIIYLEMYLAGKITIPEQKRNFLKSIFQIISFLIDQNDLDRFRKVLEFGGLVTNKNFTRLLKYAYDLGRNDIVDLMNGVKN